MWCRFVLSIAFWFHWQWSKLLHRAGLLVWDSAVMELKFGQRGPCIIGRKTALVWTIIQVIEKLLLGLLLSVRILWSSKFRGQSSWGNRSPCQTFCWNFPILWISDTLLHSCSSEINGKCPSTNFAKREHTNAEVPVVNYKTARLPNPTHYRCVTALQY